MPAKYPPAERLKCAADLVDTIAIASTASFRLRQRVKNILCTPPNRCGRPMAMHAPIKLSLATPIKRADGLAPGERGPMSDQLIEALRAATERIAFQRKALREANVICRVYPQGLVFSCHVRRNEGDDLPMPVGHEEVTWEELRAFDAERAIAIVDRVCEKAHKILAEPKPWRPFVVRTTQ
jgi:hypothetical protein